MTTIMKSINAHYARFSAYLLGFLTQYDHYDKFEKHLKYGSRITLYSTIAFIVLAALALIFACGAESARKTGYVFAALASLVLLLIAVGFMFWIFGVAEASGFCGALRAVNSGDTSVLTAHGASADFVTFV